MTRITQRMLSQSTLSNLQHSIGRTEKLQERLSTGRVLNRPSDSPTGLVTAMQTRSSLARNGTHLRSLDNAKGWIDTADSALQGSSSMLRQARDLVVQGAHSTVGQIGRNSIAQEIESIRAGLLEVANTRYAGRQLFAGNADAPGAFDSNGVYLGDTGAVNRTVADGQQVRINVVGSDAFGDDATSVFALLAKIADDLRNNPETVGDSLTAIDASIDRVLTALGDLGARSHRIDGIHERARTQTMNLQTRLSEVESTDLTETIMELQLQEVAYQSALAATSRVIQPSLLDFLR